MTRALWLIGLFGAAGCVPMYGREPVMGTGTAVTVVQPTVVAVDTGPDIQVSIDVFINVLAPYGSWEQHPTLGLVWRPADSSYVPYTNGYWAYTEQGATWMSTDEVGWAVCHYGRWVYLDGWVWIPGETWGPAWVDWRESEEYAGWAPLPPDGWAEPIAYAQYTFVTIQQIFVADTEYFTPSYDVWTSSAPIARYDRFCRGPDRGRLARRGVQVQVQPGGPQRIYVQRDRNRRPHVTMQAPGEAPGVVRVGEGRLESPRGLARIDRERRQELADRRRFEESARHARRAEDRWLAIERARGLEARRRRGEVLEGSVPRVQPSAVGVREPTISRWDTVVIPSRPVGAYVPPETVIDPSTVVTPRFDVAPAVVNPSPVESAPQLEVRGPPPVDRAQVERVQQEAFLRAQLADRARFEAQRVEEARAFEHARVEREAAYRAQRQLAEQARFEREQANRVRVMPRVEPQRLETRRFETRQVEPARVAPARVEPPRGFDSPRVAPPRVTVTPTQGGPRAGAPQRSAPVQASPVFMRRGPRR
jgi:hypothetical protein